MTPTPEQVAQWALDAGISKLTHPAALHRFAVKACAYQAEQDAMDAARYRWLKSEHMLSWWNQDHTTPYATIRAYSDRNVDGDFESLDAAIDAAIRANAPKEPK